MLKKLIIANWKMNPATLKEAVALAKIVERGIRGVKNIEVVLAPPHPFLSAVGRELKKAELGAQDVFWENTGPFTGEVSVGQLRDAAVDTVIIGHSERRANLGETDEMVMRKAAAATAGGIRAVVCVGERDRAGNEIPEIVAIQLEAALSGIKKSFLKNLVIAYEPVWAISTSPRARPDTPESAFRAVAYIRKIITRRCGGRWGKELRVIYGGSVSAANIASFLGEGRMQGALVGGASLKPNEFINIVKIAEKMHS